MMYLSISVHFCRFHADGKSANVQELLPGVQDGKVLRMCTSEQQDHFGQIQTGSDETSGACYVYGIANLLDKQEVLQKGDSVRFQVASVRSTGKRIATNVASSRRFLHARVDSIKGQVLIFTDCCYCSEIAVIALSTSYYYYYYYSYIVTVISK